MVFVWPCWLAGDSGRSMERLWPFRFLLPKVSLNSIFGKKKKKNPLKQLSAVIGCILIVWALKLAGHRTEVSLLESGLAAHIWNLQILRSREISSRRLQACHSVMTVYASLFPAGCYGLCFPQIPEPFSLWTLPRTTWNFFLCPFVLPVWLFVFKNLETWRVLGVGLVCDSDEITTMSTMVQWHKQSSNKEVSINMLPCCLINEEVFSYMPRKRLGLKKFFLNPLFTVWTRRWSWIEKKKAENWITFLLG